MASEAVGVASVPAKADNHLGATTALVPTSRALGYAGGTSRDGFAGLEGAALPGGLLIRAA